MRWFRYAMGMALASGMGCIPADSNIVGPAPVGAVACTPACSAAQRCVNGFCVGEGLLRFTLTWDHPGDVDLHVVTPGGQTVSWRNTSAGGGALDRDDVRGTGPENVFWSAAPPLGTYVVCAIPYAITQPTSFALDVRLPSGATDRRLGMRAPDATAPSAACSAASPFFVASYTLTDGVADAGSPDAGALPDGFTLPDVQGFPDLPELPDLPGLPDAAVAD